MSLQRIVLLATFIPVAFFGPTSFAQQSPKSDKPAGVDKQPEAKQTPETQDPKPATPKEAAGPEPKPAEQPKADKAQDKGIKVEEASLEDRVKILQGLLSQAERRQANTLRDLAAARESRRKAELALARVTEDLVRTTRRMKLLEKEVAKKRAGMKPADLPGKEVKLDKRFLPGGVLDPDHIVLRINGEKIDRGDLIYRLYYNYALDYFDSFIRVCLVQQEAARLGIASEPKEHISWAAKKLVDLTTENGGPVKFENKLRAQGKSLELVEAVLRVNAEFAVLVEKLVAHRRTSDAGTALLEREARKLYRERHKGAVRASHIYWKTHKLPKDSPLPDQYLKEAEMVLKRLKAGDKFTDLARKYSQDKRSKKLGGDLGVVDEKTFPTLKRLTREIFATKKGAVRLVKSNVGIHIVKVDAVLPPALSWDQAKPELMRELRRGEATPDEMKRLFEELRNKAKIERKLTVD